MIACDLILTNLRVLDVFRLRVFSGWIGISDGKFLYVEEGPFPQDLPTGGPGTEVRDLGGAIVSPGLIDAHMHIESSLLTPRRFAEAVIPHGTTTVLADPHEVANVAGQEGVRRFMEAARGLPLAVKIALPSCIPATSPAIEYTAGLFDAGVVEEFSSDPDVLALGEVMDYRRVLSELSRHGLGPEGQGGDIELLPMTAAAKKAGLLVEGHVPTLRGTDLSEYIYPGIGSDHTLTTPDKLAEQLSKGLTVMLQAKSLSTEVVSAVMALPDRSRVLLVTDDVEPSLLSDGHLSSILMKAVEAGMDPLEATASATIRPARYLGLDRGEERLGGIAPGLRADFLVLEDLAVYPPREVWTGGKAVFRAGVYRPEGVAARTVTAGKVPEHDPGSSLRGVPCVLPGPFGPEDFLVPETSWTKAAANAVRVENIHNSLTRIEKIPVLLHRGFPLWDAEETRNEDLAVLAVFARNGSSRCIGIVKNLGLKRGAYASSFAHDSHNLLVVGRRAEDMAHAANAVRGEGGGLAVVEEGRRDVLLPLPVFGLLSDESASEVSERLEEVESALCRLGMKRSRPFLMLSLLSLSVSPYGKISDRGIVDTEGRCLLPPFTVRI